MELHIQEVFKLIRDGNKNAFLQLNIKLRIFMNPDPNIGEITRIYNHYQINDYQREEINSKLTLVIIENILSGEKLEKMNNWTELKMYSKRIAKTLILEFFRKKKKSQEIFQDYDDYIFDDKGDMISKQFLVEEEIINSKEDFEKECKKICNEILSLASAKCIEIFEAQLSGKTTQETLIFFRENSNFRIRNRTNLANARYNCKNDLINKVRNDNRYPYWKEIFENN